MIDQFRRHVYCTSFECLHDLIIEPSQDDVEVRRRILAKGWYIDLESERNAILIGNEDKIDAHGWPTTLKGGFSQAEIEKLINDPRFKFAEDKHFCSLECAGKDA